MCSFILSQWRKLSVGVIYERIYLLLAVARTVVAQRRKAKDGSDNQTYKKGKEDVDPRIEGFHLECDDALTTESCFTLTLFSAVAAASFPNCCL